MKCISVESFVAFDDTVFKTSELCELYEQSFLTDSQLEECFHFFHKKHNNVGDLDNATKPSDATHYKFIIERNEYMQSIKLYECFRTYPSRKLCNHNTLLGLIINHNLDFVVLKAAHEDCTDFRHQGKSTYKIKEFYNFLDKLKIQTI